MARNKPQVNHWLSWARVDFERGLGGVEAHARSLKREFTSLGYEAQLSNDPKILISHYQLPSWIIQTHGSGLSWRDIGRLALIKITGKKKATHLHTLHGSTFGRMLACHEFFWLGGYDAGIREWVTSLICDTVLLVTPGLSIEKWLNFFQIPTKLIWNGYDSFFEKKNDLTTHTASNPTSTTFAWAFVGRDQDPVKNIDLLKQLLRLDAELKVVAIPGTSCDTNQATHTRMQPLGPKWGQALQHVLMQCQGLILTSLYEGMPLVVLEALALGLPVVCTPAGGIPYLQKQLNPEGLHMSSTFEPSDLKNCLEQAKIIANDQNARNKRAKHNRSQLPSWEWVARTILEISDEKNS